MLNMRLCTKNDLKVSHRKQVNAPSNMTLVTSLINFEYQPCGIFEGLSYHQEDEVINPTIFAATVVLGDRINKLVSSKFMGMVRPVSVIFDTGSTYSCSYNKGEFVKLEEKTFPGNLKVIAKGLDIYVFGVVEYSVRSESVLIIALWAQAYYVPGLPKYLCMISPQGIFTSEGYKVTFIARFHDDHDSYVELNLKSGNPIWQKAEPVDRVYVKYNQITTLQLMKLLSLIRYRSSSSHLQVLSVSLTMLTKTSPLHSKSYSRRTLDWDILGSNISNG